MKVEVIRSFGAYRVGDLLDPADGVANVWLQRGFAKRVESESQEKSLDQPPKDKSMKRENVKRKAVKRGQ